MGTICGLIGRRVVPVTARVSVGVGILLGAGGALVGGLLAAGLSVGASAGGLVAIVVIAEIVFAIGAVVLGSAIGREKRLARQTQAVAPTAGRAGTVAPVQAPRTAGAPPEQHG